MQARVELPKAFNIKESTPAKYDVLSAKRVETQYGETHVLKTREGHEVWANTKINSFLASNAAPFTLQIKQGES